MSKLIKELRELAASEEVADRAADELERIIALDSESKLEDRDETIKILEREVAQQGFYNEELRKQCDTLEFRAGDALDRAVRAEQQNEELRKELADKIHLLAESSADIAALQANLDAVMLEYCPDEMTPEQIAEWGKHQVQSTEPVAEMKDLNTMLVMNAEIASLKQQLAEEQRENEEVMRQKAYQYQQAKKAEEELAALKAQSTPASVWLWRNKITVCVFATKELAMQMNSGGLSTWVEPVEVPVIGNTTPPTAEALVKDFRKRAVEALKELEASAKKNIDRGAVSAAEMMQAYQYAQKSIESLPLIGEK